MYMYICVYPIFENKCMIKCAYLMTLSACKTPNAHTQIYSAERNLFRWVLQGQMFSIFCC